MLQPVLLINHVNHVSKIVMKMNINNDFEYYPEESQDNFNFKEFLTKYLKFWPYIFGCMIIGLGVAYFFNKHQAPEYMIKSSLMINENDQNLSLIHISEPTRPY